jgi:hypothetical protein
LISEARIDSTDTPLSVEDDCSEHDMDDLIFRTGIFVFFVLA